MSWQDALRKVLACARRNLWTPVITIWVRGSSLSGTCPGGMGSPLCFSSPCMPVWAVPVPTLNISNGVSPLFLIGPLSRHSKKRHARESEAVGGPVRKAVFYVRGESLGSEEAGELFTLADGPRTQDFPGIPPLSPL